MRLVLRNEGKNTGKNAPASLTEMLITNIGPLAELVIILWLAIAAVVAVFQLF